MTTPYEIVQSMFQEVLDDGDYVTFDAARETVRRMRIEHAAAHAAFLEDNAEFLYAKKLEALKRSISAQLAHGRAASRFAEAAETGDMETLARYARLEGERPNRAFEAALQEARAKKAARVRAEDDGD
jgi:hypothetical protein